MALFCAIVRTKVMLFADPRAVPSMLSPYVLMNRIVGKNHITPEGTLDLRKMASLRAKVQGFYRAMDRRA
jgi:hypothetical protein